MATTASGGPYAVSVIKITTGGGANTLNAGAGTGSGDPILDLCNGTTLVFKDMTAAQVQAYQVKAN